MAGEFDGGIVFDVEADEGGRGAGSDIGGSDLIGVKKGLESGAQGGGFADVIRALKDINAWGEGDFGVGVFAEVNEFYGAYTLC